jgi:uncharacterized protein (UPF0147 family)
MTKFGSIIEELQELQEEGVSKSISVRIESIILNLQTQDKDDSIKINKALSILDEIANDAHIEPDIRTMFWNVSSILESKLA